MGKVTIYDAFNEATGTNTLSHSYSGRVHGRADCSPTAWGMIGVGSVIEWTKTGESCECCGVLVYVATITTDGYPVNRLVVEKEDLADDGVNLVIHHSTRCQAFRVGKSSPNTVGAPAAAGGLLPAGGGDRSGAGDRPDAQGTPEQAGGL